MDSDRAQPRATPTFLVERYWPGVDEAAFSAVLPRLEQVARAMTKEGITVQHVGSLLMSADEVVFTVWAAESRAHVEAVNERAELPVDRIAPVITVGFEDGADPPLDRWKQAHPADRRRHGTRSQRKGED